MAEKARLPCLIKSPVLYSHFIQSRPENVQFSPTGCNWAQRAIIAEPLCCKALQMNATQCNIMEYNRSVRPTFRAPTVFRSADVGGMNEGGAMATAIQDAAARAEAK